MKISGGDFFCGAGGFTEGAMQAIALLGGTVTDWLAINHWPRAIATHTANHPSARHLCVRLDQVRPEDALRRGKMDLLLASPECTHHSVARGGKPMSDQSRAGAWSIIDWVNRVHIETLLIENVREFRNWGPLNKRGLPIKRQAGQTYQAFLNALRAAGYTVEDRILNAADFGDPTTRQRLFIQAQRTRAVVWPEPSHVGKWRAAREIIDWKLKGESIFARKRPLSDKTLARIEAGLRKFGLKPFLVPKEGIFSKNAPRSVDAPVNTVIGDGRVHLAEPYIVEWDHQGGNGNGCRPAAAPMSTVTTKARHGLVEPFLVPHFGERKGQKPRARKISAPLPAVTGQGAGSLVEPFLVELRGTHESQLSGSAKSVDGPVPTISTSGAHCAVVSPFLVQTAHGNDDRTGNERRAKSVDKPLATVRTANEWGVCEPYLIQTAHKGKRRARSIKEPMPTVAGNRGDVAVVEPMLIGQQSCAAARPVSQPAPTVATAGAIGLVEPFLVKYFSNGGAHSVNAPLDTLTTKPRYGLVLPVIEIDGQKYILDIRFRMLQPGELAAAQGFPKEYKFTGNKSETVKQIGNAVPVNLACALVKAAMGGCHGRA